MNRIKNLTKIPALVVSTLTITTLGFAAVVFADDAPPPANSAPPADGQNGRHHNPAWAACKKQADDQKLEPGDARKEFMTHCLKSSKDSAPAAS